MKTHNIDEVRSAEVERSANGVSFATAPVSGISPVEFPSSRLSPAQRQQLLVEWNNTAADFPKDKCVHQLFEEQVARTPNALAVSDGKSELTYAELNVRAERVAKILRELGIAPDARVGVCVERRVEMVVSKLAVWKAGAAYVPFDPASPRERLSFMLGDANISVLLTQKPLRERFNFENTNLKVICVDELPDGNDFVPNSELPSPNSKNLAYVIYTSGSTGQPKGVEIEHRSLANLIAWHQRIYNVTPLDRASQIAAPAFDASVWEIWPYLTCGASLHICDDETRLSPQKLIQWFAEKRITLAFLPTPIAEATFAEAWPQNISLRAMLTGGDKLHRPPPENFPCKLFNHYGPTENTVVTTWNLVPPDVTKASSPSIGRPIANTQVFVLDENLELVPIGEVGELHIGGVGLARGYLNRAELTAEKFIKNPLVGQASCLTEQAGSLSHYLYKTGDLVRWLPNGELEFLGRIDNQVKIRGNRIELGEIEFALQLHEAVREAVVIARADNSNQQRLAAYIICAPGNKFRWSENAQPKNGERDFGSRDSLRQTISAHDLHEFLKLRLPEYMVPSAFVFLDTYPLTSNGKIDRNALPAPTFEVETDFVAPRTRAEETLVAIWREILGVQKIGVRDNFFDLGGHSLMATQVISRIRDAFEIELPLHDLFESPTIEQLAEKIGEAPLFQIPEMTRFQRNCVTPISFAQERMWFVEQMHPNFPIHTVPIALRLEGEINFNALESAFNEIIRRHEVLRLIFKNQNGKPVAVTDAPKPFSISVTDLSGLLEEERKRELQGLACKEATRPFNLAESPLLRARLVRLAADAHVLLVTAHHIVFDGWSLGVFYRELSALYGNFSGAFTNGHTRQLPELKFAFADFAHWQRNWLQNGSLERELNYWKLKLSGAPMALDLPTDRPRPAVQTFNGKAKYFTLGAELTAQLRRASQRENVTLFMLLLAAFQTLLHRYSAQETILVGSPIAGRTRSETENLIGLFLNTLILRADFSDGATFRELLQQIKKNSLEAFANQNVPLEKIVDALQIERDASRPPLAQVMFVLQNESLRAPELAGLKTKILPVHNGVAKFDIELSLEETDDGLDGYLEFNTDLFDETTIERMLGHFQTLLEGVIANPTEKISSLPILTESERHKMLVEWNDNAADFPKDKCVHQLFEEQVARTPDAVALIFDDEQMTYRELNERADQLAKQLRALGVAPDSRVAICVQRSMEMLVGVMGILKAGGCYLPLDPNYPKERLQFMLEDSQAAVLVTQTSLRDNLNFEISNLKVVCIDDANFESQILNSESETIRNSQFANLNSENLCYLIYTSGSTGQPKGVMVTHRNVVNLFEGLDRLLGSEPGVWISVCSMSFDLSVTEFFYTLARGSKVVIKPDKFFTIPSLILRHGVTHWQSSVSMMRQLSLMPDADKAIRQLKKVLLGGEPLSVSFAKQLREMMTGDLINLCGPTETTVWCQAFPVTEIGETNPLPIGKPLANTQMYILDTHLQPVPICVAGEIFIAGECVSRGYLNRPELTAKKYLPNPFGTGKLYASGDVGRFRADGVIEIIGRSDFQVKIRGHRIELGEIELALTKHPAVREAVVMAQEFSGDKRLVAYPVLKTNGNGAPHLEINELREFLTNRLPEVMIPSAFVFLDKLPLTPSGKVNRKALPLPEIQNANGNGAAHSAPQSDLEKSIAKIWRELLRIEKIGLHDNFFDLGGHSLLVVEAQAKLRESLGFDLPVVKLFQYPTIHSLAIFLKEHGNDSFDAIHDRCRMKHAAHLRRKEEHVS